MDLLDHEMFVSCFFCCLGIPFNDFHFLLDLIAVQIVEGDLSLFHTCHFHVADVINVPGIFQDCRHIRGNVGGTVCHAQDHGAVFSRHIQLSRIFFKHNGKGIRTADTHHGMVDGIDGSSQVFFIIIVYQLHSHFCICRGIEGVSLAGQLIL